MMEMVRADELRADGQAGLSAVRHWPYAEEVAKTSAVICTLLGALLGISTAEYNKTANDGM